MKLKVLYLGKSVLIGSLEEKFFSSLCIPNYAWRTEKEILIRLKNEHVILMMIRQANRIMKKTKSYDNLVIKLGCGFGFNAIVMALSGARNVTALE